MALAPASDVLLNLLTKAWLKKAVWTLLFSAYLCYTNEDNHEYKSVLLTHSKAKSRSHVIKNEQMK
jgi:hypothetical protein